MKRAILGVLLASVLWLEGCTIPAWVNTVESVAEVAAPIAASLIDVADPALAPVVTLIDNGFNALVTTLDTYKASPTATHLQAVQAAFEAVNNNVTQLESAAQIKNPATDTKVTAIVQLLTQAVTEIAAQVPPATSASMGISASPHSRRGKGHEGQGLQKAVQQHYQGRPEVQAPEVIGSSGHRAIDSFKGCPSSVVSCNGPRAEGEDRRQAVTTDHGPPTTDQGLNMSIDHSHLKLGKRPRRHDVRTLMMARYLTGALPAAPARVDYTHGIADWGMMLNDQLGCCTIAAVGHAVQTWTANAIGRELTVPDSAILATYEKWDGYNPTDPSTDLGGVELDVLKAWRQQGFDGADAGCVCGDRSRDSGLGTRDSRFGQLRL